MTVKRDPSVLLLDTLENYPLNEYYSPIHTVNPDTNRRNMMNLRVAVDFYWVAQSNTSSRFLCVEADVTGESSDYGDVVMYGLTYVNNRWLPVYRTLRELGEHEYILLPQYRTGNQVQDALLMLTP